MIGEGRSMEDCSTVTWELLTTQSLSRYHHTKTTKQNPLHHSLSHHLVAFPGATSFYKLRPCNPTKISSQSQTNSVTVTNSLKTQHLLIVIVMYPTTTTTTTLTSWLTHWLYHPLFDFFSVLTFSFPHTVGIITRVPLC